MLAESTRWTKPDAEHSLSLSVTAAACFAIARRTSLRDAEDRHQGPHAASVLGSRLTSGMDAMGGW
eukprot:2160332-Rhodomonas_salina.1